MYLYSEIVATPILVWAAVFPFPGPLPWDSSLLLTCRLSSLFFGPVLWCPPLELCGRGHGHSKPQSQAGQWLQGLLGQQCTGLTAWACCCVLTPLPSGLVLLLWSGVGVLGVISLLWFCILERLVELHTYEKCGSESQIIPPHDAGISSSIESNLQVWPGVVEQSDNIRENALCFDFLEDVCDAYYKLITSQLCRKKSAFCIACHREVDSTTRCHP